FFRPGFWWDMLYPAKVLSPGVEIAQITENLNVGESIELRVAGLINIKINRVLIAVIKTIDGIMNHFFIKAIMNC
ncbi:hypothetical protein BTM22_10710, partial [Vibrio parahaemolyticus]